MKPAWWRAGTCALMLGGLVAGLADINSAQACSRQDFGSWLRQFDAEAGAAGISARTRRQALHGLRPDPSVIKRDRRQNVFSQSFLKFSGRMVAAYRLKRGGQLIRKYRNLFARIKRDYGVPAPVIVGFWGLETDFGAFVGDMHTVRSLATLAHDCRRPEKFRPELLAALQIIDRGDLSVSEMRGPWAGELGQTQFLPSHYLTHAVDYDGDGRRDLLRSTPDVLASTANLLHHLGWRRGEPWLREVSVPRSMPWQQAQLGIRHPHAAWNKWGVRLRGGGRLPNGGPAAALLLPMGRNGPAFLAYPNFDVYLEWNHSMVYATTAAYFATRLAGAPRVSRGRAEVKPLSFNEIKRLQHVLVARGYDVGKVDGIIGRKTRAAVRRQQESMGLPADGYPTTGFLKALR